MGRACVGGSQILHIDTDQRFWELNANLKEYRGNPTYGSYMLAGNCKFIKWNNLMKDV